MKNYILGIITGAVVLVAVLHAIFLYNLRKVVLTNDTRLNEVVAVVCAQAGGTMQNGNCQIPAQNNGERK